MSLRNFLKDFKVSSVSPAAVAATTSITSSVLDMSGFDSVVFIALLGDVTTGSVLSLTVKENTANSTSSPTPAAITGGATADFTADTTSADSKLLISDVMRPDMRYVFCVLARGTANAVVNSILAIQYNAKSLPVTQSTDVIASVFAMNG